MIDDKKSGRPRELESILKSSPVSMDKYPDPSKGLPQLPLSLPIPHGTQLRKTDPFQGVEAFSTRKFASQDELAQELLTACQTGDTPKVFFLLGRNVSRSHLRGAYGTALQTAVVFGHRPIVELLLDRGAVADEDCETSSLTELCVTQKALSENSVKIEIRTALHVAVVTGEADLVRMLLQNGADPNCALKPVDTPLKYAIIKQNPRCVEALLRAKAIIHDKDGMIADAFVTAAYVGNKEIIELLKKYGGDVNRSSGEYGTPLQAAISGGHESIAEKLLELGAIDQANGIFGSALGAAAFFEMHGMVERLLKLNSTLEISSEIFSSPLTMAARQGNLDIVRTLVMHGAQILSVNKQSTHVNCPMVAAARCGAKDVIKFLKVNDCVIMDGQPLIQAAIDGRHPYCILALVKLGVSVRGLHACLKSALESSTNEPRMLDAARYLFDKGAQPDREAISAAVLAGDVKFMVHLIKFGMKLQDHVRPSRLFCKAIEGGKCSMLNLLLKQSMDAILKSEPGESFPLEAAVLSGSWKMADLLLSHLDVINDTESTRNLLYTAISSGETEIVQKLLEKGIKFSPNGRDGENILLGPVTQNNQQLVKLLLKQGAQPSYSVLQSAVEVRNLSIVRILIGAEAGAEDRRISHGEDEADPDTLAIAVRNGDTEIVEALLDAKIRPASPSTRVRNNAGYVTTVLKEAIRHGHEMIAKLLIERGADVNDSGETSPRKGFPRSLPLGLAVDKGMIAIVGLLLQYGSQANCLEEDEQVQLLSSAIHNRDRRLTQLLVDAGADYRLLTELDESDRDFLESITGRLQHSPNTRSLRRLSASKSPSKRYHELQDAPATDELDFKRSPTSVATRVADKQLSLRPADMSTRTRPADRRSRTHSTWHRRSESLPLPSTGRYRAIDESRNYLPNFREDDQFDHVPRDFYGQDGFNGASRGSSEEHDTDGGSEEKIIGRLWGKDVFDEIETAVERFSEVYQRYSQLRPPPPPSPRPRPRPRPRSEVIYEFHTRNPPDVICFMHDDDSESDRSW